MASCKGLKGGFAPYVLFDPLMSDKRWWYYLLDVTPQREIKNYKIVI